MTSFGNGHPRQQPHNKDLPAAQQRLLARAARRFI
jgi:hypothetical protein